MTQRALSDQQFTELTNTFSHGYAGGTRNVHTTEHHPIGTTGFVVAIPGHERTESGPSVVQHVAEHRSSMLADPKVQADRLATQGSWHVHPDQAAVAPKGEEVTYDRGTLVPFERGLTRGPTARRNARGRAVAMGRQNAQRAVFDLEKGEDINLPGAKMHDALAQDIALSKQFPRGKADWIGR